MNKQIIFLTMIFVISLNCLAQNEHELLELINLPPDFDISIYAHNLPGARSMTQADDGIIFIGTRNQGVVYALLDRDGDNIVEQKLTVLRGLNNPNGVAYISGNLYVAEISRITRYSHIIQNLNNPGNPEIAYSALPKDTHHGWKYLAYGPDGYLYFPVGAPCNVCESANPLYASLLRIKPDGTGMEIYARGIRNTVGFDWHPLTGELWFTDNGRDWLGDNKPPDELNHAPVKGLNFGFPYFHGSNISDPELGGDKKQEDYQTPAMDLGPHVAALGMKFYTGSMFPQEYSNNILIAEHGSWNRSVPIGYRITLVRLNGNNALSYEVFASGWLVNGQAWGRPVDLLVLKDGSLLVSDDKAGIIYRISYTQ
jgi:glucose/arabinose dehydrogenase